MQDKHITGPWAVTDDHGQRWIETTSGNDDTIAQIHRRIERKDGKRVGADSDHEFQANAHLIANAPSMLATLQQIERLSREADGSLVNVTAMLGDIARAAIAKATGSAP